jgi:hypothetical protein
MTLLLFLCDYGTEFFVIFATSELYRPVTQGKKRMVVSASNIFPIADIGATLTDYVTARRYKLTVSDLYAQAFCITVSAVGG